MHAAIQLLTKDFPQGRHTTPPSESNLMYTGKKKEPHLYWIYFSREVWVILILDVLINDFNPAWSIYTVCDFSLPTTVIIKVAITNCVSGHLFAFVTF